MSDVKCPLCKEQFKTIEEFMKHLDNPVCKMVANNDIDGLLNYANKP